MSKSHTRIVLSSDDVMNLRFSSTNVIVLTGPRCWSYSCVISPDLMSYCDRQNVVQHCAPFLRKSGGFRTHLDNLLVTHAGEEDVLLLGVVLDAVRNLAIRESLFALSY